MQTAGFSSLNAWFTARRTEILDRIEQELGARHPLLQQSAPPEQLRAMRGRFFDGFLLALRERRSDVLAEPLGVVLLARIQAGLSLEEALSIVGIVRRIFLRPLIQAVTENVEGADTAATFVDEVLDLATTRVAALHAESLARAQAALVHSEDQHRWLWQRLPAMMHSIDAEGRLCMVNDQWLATLGYTAEEVLGRRSSEFLTPESARYAREEVLPAFYRTGRCDNVLYQMICKDGRLLEVMLSAIAERDATGKVVRSQAVLLDVTERQRVERALQESESRYRDLVELSPDGVAVLRKGRILYINRSGARTLGYEDSAALVGREITEFSPAAERDGLRARVAQVEARRGPIKAQGDAFLARDGRVVRVETVGAPVLYEGAPALQIVFRDVTERRHAEEAARRSAMQEEVIRAQEEMLRALSTPLVPLGEGLLLMPLVGTVDRARAEQIRTALLEGVAAHRAAVVILDVTGVPAMDEAVVGAVVGGARAAKLLGAHVLVTGLSAAAAQALVSLGVELGGIVTYANVRDGIAAARRRIERAPIR